MSNEETREFIGCLLIPDGPISIDYNNINFIHDDFGINNETKSILNLSSTTIMIGDVKQIEFALYSLLFNTIRKIEHDRIPGELILYFEKIQLRWDVKFTCSIYRK